MSSFGWPLRSTITSIIWKFYQNIYFKDLWLIPISAWKNDDVTRGNMFTILWQGLDDKANDYIFIIRDFYQSIFVYKELWLIPISTWKNVYMARDYMFTILWQD